MNFSKKTVRILLSSLIVVSMLASMLVCALVTGATEVDRLSDVGADTYYIYGLATNDPNFGGMSGPTGTFTYDSSQGYYYYDASFTGDYCFVVASMSGNGAQAVKSPAVGNVAEAGNYYLQQGNYHGYVCMHLWNPNGDKVRIYFRTASGGLYAIKSGGTVVNPTQPPATQAPATQKPTSSSGTSYVYCENAAGWSTVKAYMWVRDTENSNAQWPGASMTNIGGNIWRYQVPSGYNMIIFNNGNSGPGNQTENLDYPGAGYIYNNSTGQWSKYGGGSQSTDPPATQAPATQAPATQRPSSSTGKKLVYCENAAGWSSVNCYMWIKDTETNNAGWPGVKMTKQSGNIWQYEVSGGFNMIIFSEGGNNQTSNMNFPGAGYIYNNKTKEWSVYDTSPLQVTAIATDMESPVFNGVAVTLSATATGQGTVAYKFSATNKSTGQTAVLSDYSTKNYAKWVPASAGTYTLKYEFRDTSGNTNSRTKDFTVENGQSAVAPYIKDVTPGSGQIQKGKACNVSVSAGGGVVGTKLLFYKFTVTDPSGKTANTPYYTLNSNYSFTPSALGNYTLTVDVQGSDNAADVRNLTLNSVNTVTTENYATIGPGSATVAPGVYLKGDADSDGLLSIMDATRIQRVLAELEPESKLNRKNADTDNDGIVDILDVTRIQRRLAELPVENW